jgi:diadenosine tetraphosphate (Ap4A) HIT family hydrolase
MSGDHTEIWDYIMDTRKEAAADEARIRKLESPTTAALALKFAGYLANRMGLEACNFITSAGAAATQSVPHLHVHVIPRRDGDGLALPWTGQQESGPAS